ncbi:MAG: DUF4249 family protein [candidate division Zixibacteria bacterium]|nr:DUF4249 family protein [candidate division Zixibacteria bacterium]
MRLFVLWSFGLMFLSCSVTREPGSLFGPADQHTPVIDALLIVDRPMPDIFVRQTLSPAVTYTREAAAVHGAEVTLYQDAAEYRFVDAGDTLGRYTPPSGAPPIRPETEYRLRVRIGTKEVNARTLTPSRFELEENVLIDKKTLQPIRQLKSFRDTPSEVFTAPENQVRYQEHLLETHFQPVGVKGYQVGVLSLDIGSEYVIEGDFLDEEDFEDFERYGSSPAFEAADGKLRLPWFAIYYAGRHILRIYAVDDNWFDFIRTGPEQPEGLGNLAGDNLERPIFHVDGGIGLFGSASVDSLGFVVLPKAGN